MVAVEEELLRDRLGVGAFDDWFCRDRRALARNRLSSMRRTCSGVVSGCGCAAAEVEGGGVEGRAVGAMLAVQVRLQFLRCMAETREEREIEIGRTRSVTVVGGPIESGFCEVLPNSSGA